MAGLREQVEAEQAVLAARQIAAERAEAIDRAVARNDWYVLHGGKTGYGTVCVGPYGEREARVKLRAIIAAHNKRVKLLRVTEDYEV